ncbi:MAG TPA: hypothetical protein VNY36_05740, partial [Bacteroidia bacterium]|nr:hypothetical protein [Bacteroidia bacterium]
MKQYYIPSLYGLAIFLLFNGSILKAQQANPLIHSVQATNTVAKQDVFKDVVEDVSKRTPYSSTWKTKNGKVLIQYSSTIINYTDANGALQPVSTNLKSNANGWVANQQPNPCYFHTDRSTAINIGGNNEIVFNRNCSINGMQFDQQLKLVHDNIIKLDMEEGIHKEITFVTNGIKTNYVFDKPLENGINTSEEIEFPAGCIFEKDTNNGIKKAGGWAGDYILLSADSKHELARFHAAECYDAQKHWCYANYNVEKKDGKNILTASIPNEWLSKAVYPVTLDPLVVGPTSNWAGGSTPSCLYPNFYTDSILVTIPAGITITFFTIDYAYVTSSVVTDVIPLGDGLFYLSTPCAKTDTLSCHVDTAGICYLVPLEDFHSPMTCCYKPSCSPQSFWLDVHLSRHHGGFGCDTSTVWYSKGYYTGYQYYFSAYIEGYTDSVTSVKYSPAVQCANSCSLTMTANMIFGVPPYTVSHPWAKKDTVVGSYASCTSGGKAVLKLTIPGCPYTCGTFDTITVPPPVVVDACGDTVRNIPSQKVILKPVPVLNIKPDTIAVCTGTPINLTITSCLPGTTYAWGGSDKVTGTGNVITDNSIDTGKGPITVTYKITGTANGCNSDTTKAIGVINPDPIIGITGKDTIELDSSTVLTATGGKTYSWTPNTGLSCVNCPNPVASPTATTTYIVTVTDSEGCDKTSSFTIVVIDENVSVPNVFTPNGDGKNDYFVIRGVEFY